MRGAFFDNLFEYCLTIGKHFAVAGQKGPSQETFHVTALNNQLVFTLWLYYCPEQSKGMMLQMQVVLEHFYTKDHLQTKDIFCATKK